jgi:light-harvesting complex 1 beta chain
MAERKGSISGLTDDEAQEFHRFWGSWGSRLLPWSHTCWSGSGDPGSDRPPKRLKETAMADARHLSHRHEGQADSVSTSTIFLLGFVLFGLIAVIGQLFGCQWRSWLPGAEGVKSMTGGVKSAVYTFMSHLQ